MSSHVGLYFDAVGNLSMIVRPHYDQPGRVLTDEDFGPHDNHPELTRVTVQTKTYTDAAPPINNRGAPFYYDLCQRALPEIQAAGFMRAGLDAHMILAGNVSVAKSQCSAAVKAIQDAIKLGDTETIVFQSALLAKAQTDLSDAKLAQVALASVVVAVG